MVLTDCHAILVVVQFTDDEPPRQCGKRLSFPAPPRRRPLDGSTCVDRKKTGVRPRSKSVAPLRPSHPLLLYYYLLLCRRQDLAPSSVEAAAN